MTLDIWAMVYTFWDTANWWWMSNWIEWEFRDRKLYKAWYDLAKDVNNSWLWTIDMLINAIDTWTNNRNNLSYSDYFELNTLKWAYRWYKIFDDLRNELSDINYNWFIPYVK